MSTAQRKWGYGLPDQAERPEPPARDGLADAAPPSPTQHLKGDVIGGMAAAIMTKIGRAHV